ncbi:MAG: DUF1127 domain-containing protein [Pseudomonadota bacterium]
MAFFDTTRPQAAGSISRGVTAFFAGLQAWREAARTRRALSKLTDRELADIGLHRSDLDMLTRREAARL